MKNLTPVKIAIHNIVTLGYYRVLWLSQSRQEMVSKYGVEIPSAKRMKVVFWFRWSAILIAVLSYCLAYNQWSKTVAEPPVQQPSQACLLQQAETNGPGALPQSTASPVCKLEVDNYLSQVDQGSKDESKGFYYIGVFYALTIACVLSVFVDTRWLSQYAAGVEAVTGGSLNKTRVEAYLWLPSFIVIPLIQRQLDRAQSSANS